MNNKQKKCATCQVTDETNKMFSDVIEWLVCPWCNDVFCNKHAKFDSSCPNSHCDGVVTRSGRDYYLLSPKGMLKKNREEREAEYQKQKLEEKVDQLCDQALNKVDKGNNHKARSILEKTIELYPNTNNKKWAEEFLETVRENLASALYDNIYNSEGNYIQDDKVIQILEKVIKKYPNTPSSESAEEKVAELILDSAEEYESNGNISKAIKRYKELLTKFPNCKYIEDVYQKLYLLD